MSAIKKTASLLGIALALLAESPFRPRWAYYRARGYLYHYVLDRFHQDRVHEYSERVRPWDEAVLYVTGHSRDDMVVRFHEGGFPINELTDHAQVQIEEYEEEGLFDLKREKRAELGVPTLSPQNRRGGRR